MEMVDMIERVADIKLSVTLDQCPLTSNGAGDVLVIIWHYTFEVGTVKVTCTQ